MGVPNSYQQRTGTDWQWTPSGYPTARLGIGDDRRVHINPRRQQSLNNIDVPLAKATREAAAAEWAAAKRALPKVPGGKQAAQKALGKAAWRDDPDAVARAVASDADVEAKVYECRDWSGKYTAVYLAARNNKLRALRCLIAAAGASPDAATGRRWRRCREPHSSPSGKRTACYTACVYRNHDAIRILLALGAQADHDTNRCKCPKDIGHRTGCKCVQCEAKK